MKKQTTPRKRKKVDPHIMMHAVIEKKLSYILNEVSANGNPGLDNSLKDLYQGNKEIKAKLDEIHQAIQPALDKAAFWNAARAMFKSSRFWQFHTTKFGAAVLAVAVFLILNAILHPFEGVAGVALLLLELLKKAL